MAIKLLVSELFQFGERLGERRDFSDAHRGSWICKIFWHNLCCLVTF